MMTAKIKSSNSQSKSDDSDSPHSPLAKTHTISSSPKPRPPKYHTNTKTKLLNLKNKTPMQRSSPNSSPIKPLSSSVLHSLPIDHHNPLTPKIFHPTSKNLILTFSLIIIFLLDLPKNLHYLLPYICIILLLLMTPIVIIRPMIPPYITSDNLLNFNPLLRRQLKLMTSR